MYSGLARMVSSHHCGKRFKVATVRDSRTKSFIKRIEVHTQTTRCDVRGNEDWRSTGFKFCQNPVAFALLFIPVDSQSRPTVLSQVLGDVIRNALSSDENKNFGVLCAYTFQVLN